MELYRLPKATAISDLTRAQAETPRPARGQVLVRMRAASLNYRDLMVATGRYGRGGSVPADLVPLSDGAGEVVEAGPDVTRVKVGDRVAGIFMQGWLAGQPDAAYAASSLGGAIDGVLAEYRVFDQDGLVQLPEHLSFEEGATLPCAAVTAWNALYAFQPLRPGETVLTLGTGGVSVFAVQFAKAAGARVIATSSSDAKLERVRALGAGETVNYKTHPDWDAEVKRLTGGRGVDHVVEVGGPGTLQRSLASTRMGGHIGLIGVLTQGQIDPSLILRGGAVVRGIYVGSREMFEAMNRAIAFHGIKPVIDRVFAFHEVQDAYRHLEGASHLGKVVIRIGG
jgi:NADPH:quinone reductase-like Zn-dependent oxidoreductase